MPTPRYYAKQSKASLGAFIADLARFLVNDLGGSTGPAWTIIEGYDADFGSAPKRRTPGSPSDMDSFPDGFGWKTDSLAAGDWIVLRSATSVSGTKFELYLEYDTTTNLAMKLIPLDDFATGGADASPPTLPSTSVGAGTSLVAFTGFAGTASYSIVADEAMVAILADDGSTPYWVYAGEVDAARTNGSPADDRPYVIYDTPGSVRLYMYDASWNRLSPADDTTVLTTGYAASLYMSAGVVLTAGYDESLLGTWSIVPVPIYFHDTSHRHLAGWLRNVGMVSPSLGASGTLASKSWMYRNSAVASGYPGVALRWDSSTAYP